MVDVKLNVAEVLFTNPEGPAVIVVSGAIGVAVGVGATVPTRVDVAVGPAAAVGVDVAGAAGVVTEIVFDGLEVRPAPSTATT
jgi:hypothetical protein